jgi:hypothetical protein
MRVVQKMPLNVAEAHHLENVDHSARSSLLQIPEIEKEPERMPGKSMLSVMMS